MSRLVYLLAVLTTYTSLAAAQAPQIGILTFKDVTPPGMSLDEIWSALGMDYQNRLYVGIAVNKYSGIGDTAIFRYTPDTGTKEFLGSLRAVSRQQGNLQANERIAKVHTDIIEYRGKMYLASHDFHGGENPATVRGGHFYSYDVASGQWEDLSAAEPGGVSAPHEGLIALTILREQNQLVSLTFPSGLLVVFDLATKRSTRYPAPTTLSNVSRKIFATDKAVFFSYYPRGGGSRSPLWRYDAATKQIVRTDKTLPYGILQQTKETKDRSTLYLQDERGGLFAFDTQSERLTDLGAVLPGGGRVDLVMAMVLAHDEKRLFSLVSYGERKLYTYDIVSGTKGTTADFQPAFSVQDVAGAVLDRQGRMYTGNHNDNKPGTAQVLVISGIPGSPPLSLSPAMWPPTGLRIAR